MQVKIKMDKTDKNDNKEFSEQAGNSKNHKNKREYKFNIIDIILILVVVAAAAALIYVMGGNSLFAGDETVELLYTIEIPLIKNELIPAINKIEAGTRVTDSVRSYFIGEVQDVKVDAAFTNTINLDKNVVERNPYPDYSRVTIQVKAEKVIKDKSGYSVNGKTVRVGERIDFRTPYFVSYGNCIAVAELPKNNG